MDSSGNITTLGNYFYINGASAQTLPTNSSINSGTAFYWNTTHGTGISSIVNWAQGGGGGFSFFTGTATLAPYAVFAIDSNKNVQVYGNLQFQNASTGITFQDGTSNTSASTISNKLTITQTGSVPTGAGGTLTIKHSSTTAGTNMSSIVFTSASNSGSDCGYICYIDDVSGNTLFSNNLNYLSQYGDGYAEKSVLVIGTQNDGYENGQVMDNLLLQPTGAVILDGYNYSTGSSWTL